MKLLRNIAIAIFLSMGTLNAGYTGKSSSSSSRPSPAPSRPAVQSPRPSPSNNTPRPPSSVFNTSKPAQPTTPTASAPIWGKKADPAKPAVSSSTASSALQQKQAISPPKDKNVYVNDFKQKNAGVYVNKFTTEPTTRPTYIPTSYASGGHTYNISYNSGYGGYGYMDHLGTWIMYDALAHAATNSYARDMSYYNNQPAVVVHHSSYASTILLIGFMVLVAVIAIILFR